MSNRKWRTRTLISLVVLAVGVIAASVLGVTLTQGGLVADGTGASGQMPPAQMIGFVLAVLVAVGGFISFAANLAGWRTGRRNQTGN